MTEKDKKWLIKNNDIISGPHTVEEITAEWESGNISPFATACLPQQECWLFITNHPDFSHLKNKDTQSSVTQKSSSQTVTATITETDVSPANNSPAPPQTRGSDTVEVVHHKTTKQQHLSEIQTEVTKGINSSTFYWGAGVLAILLWGVFFFKSSKNTSDPPLNSESAQSQEGLFYFQSGYYAKAMEYWKTHNVNTKDQTLFKILQLQFENDIYSGTQIIESDTNELNTHEKQIVTALTQLKNNNKEAAKRTLMELVQQDSSKEIKTTALNNLILLSAQEGNCSEVNQYVRRSSSNNLNSFAFSLCVLKSPEANDDQKRTAKEILQTVIEKKQDYYQESLVIMAHIHQQNDRDEEALSLVRILLNVDPHLTENHYHDVFIDRTLYSWKELVPLCEDIYHSQSDNKFYTAFYAYCLARVQDYESAQRLIQQARRMDSGNTLFTALHAYIAKASHLDEESTLILGNALQNNSEFNYELPYILQAQFCETKQDWSCAVNNWLLILKINPDSLSALGGMAYSKYQEAHYEEAREYIQRGLKADIDNSYSPLIFVHLQLQNQLKAQQ